MLILLAKNCWSFTLSSTTTVFLLPTFLPPLLGQPHQLPTWATHIHPSPLQPAIYSTVNRMLPKHSYARASLDTIPHA